jgi:chromosomal replication initiator protein
MSGLGEFSDGTPAGNTDGVDVVWARVRARLRTEVGEVAFRNWLKPLTLEGFNDHTVQLSAPSPFMRDRISADFGDRIKQLWRAELTDDIEVTIAALRGRRVAVDEEGDTKDAAGTHEPGPGDHHHRL